MMRIVNPVWSRTMSNFDKLMEEMRFAQLPEDGQIVERTRMVTEKFKVSHMDNGEVRLTPITDAVARDLENDKTD